MSARESESRQRKWQKKQKLLGMCRICGKPRGRTADRCDDCQDKRNALRRKQRAEAAHGT